MMARVHGNDAIISAMILQLCPASVRQRRVGESSCRLSPTRWPRPTPLLYWVHSSFETV